MLLAELVVLALIVYGLIWIREEYALLSKTRKEFHREISDDRERLDKLRVKLDKLREKIEYKRWFYQRTDRERTLQHLADRLLPLFDNMPRVKVSIIDKPISEPPLGGTGPCLAYYQGDYRGNRHVIVLKKPYIERASKRRIEYVMKHELIHRWVHWKGIKMDDPHGHYFRKKAREVGIK